MQFKHALFVLLFVTGQAVSHGSLHIQIQDLTKTMQREGKSAPLLVKRGRLQMEHGNNKAATRDFLTALKVNPGERSAYYYLAEQAFDQNRLPDARRYAETFLAKLSGEAGGIVRGQSLYGQILLAQGEYRAAETAFMTVVEQVADPSPEHYLRLADAQGKAGATAQALASLDQGMIKLGLLPVLQNKYIELQVESKAWDSALSRLDAMIAQGQGLPELYLRKAQVLRAADRQPSAQEVVLEGLALIDQIPTPRRDTPAMKRLRAQLLAMQTAQ